MTLPATPEIFIAGCGPGSRDYVTPRVTALAMNAQLLGGVPKLLDLFPESKARRMPQNGLTEPWLDRLEATPARPCVVLVPGDPVGDRLTEQVVARFGRALCRVEPGIGTVQLACAVLGLDCKRAACFDLQSALPKELPEKTAGHAIWLFLMGAPGAEALVAEVAEQHPQDRISVIEDLSLPTESIVGTTSKELARMPPRARRIVVSERTFE
jgi:cobalt-precorrin-7 (C5)-methyltransferase